MSIWQPPVGSIVSVPSQTPASAVRVRKEDSGGRAILWIRVSAVDPAVLASAPY